MPLNLNISALTGLLALSFVSAPGATAGVSDLPPVVPASWLAENLDDPALVVLHIGPPQSYEAGHIPGALKASLRQLLTVSGEGIRDEMPSGEVLAEKLGAMGIDDRSRVVVYFSDEVAAWAAARVHLTLEYAGMAGRAAYLDGGLPGWVSEGHTTSTEIAAPEPVDVDIEIDDRVLVDTDWLRPRFDKPGTVLIDGRPAEGFSGQSGHWQRLGHIPGAANVPFFELLAEDPPYLLKTPEQLRTMFAEAGASPGDTVVTYCGTGLWGSLPYLAARHIGLDVRLYDGSFQEWSVDESLPVAASQDRAKKGAQN